MNQPDRKDFFISYNKADRAWAEWIAWGLENEGYICVLQAWDFRPGGNFVLEMDKAAKLASRTIAVLSPDYLASQFTQPEWAAAFAQDPTGAKGILVPVRVQKCEPEGLLGPIIYIDLVDLPEETARETLIAGVKKRRAKPSSSPRFPGAAPPREAPRFPGALPPIWNVPHPRNPNFTGRDELLKQLRESLTTGQATALTQAALHGLGGVGKTQIAVEYAYRFTSDYNLVWWVRSEDPVALAAEYAALAGPLNLPEKEAVDQEAQVAAVRQWLSQNGKWLLIFDNLGEPQDLKGYIPQSGGGQVLITSRNPVWRGVARNVRVWDGAESVAFLLKRTGREETAGEGEKAAAGQLADELGDLPLALEQAGAYIEACGCSIGHYLELFRSRRRELLERGQPSQDYPDTVATTWELSFQKVQTASPPAADLLNLCAFLAPKDIPIELFEKWVQHLPRRLARAVQDPVAFNDALAVLRRYSLMEVADDALAVHRLVQAVVRDRLEGKSKKKWAKAAVELVNATYPGDIRTNVEIWPRCARLLPHALAAAGYAEHLRVAFNAAGRLLNQAGFYLQIRAEFVEAKKTLEKALAIWERVLGQNHPNVAAASNNLGSVMRALGDLAGAREHYKRALGIDEAAYGTNHPEVARDVNNLGGVLQDLGDLEEARACFERALAIDEAAYGPDHPKVAIRTSNLGSVLRALGDLAGAQEHCERALAIDEAAYGPNHPDVARDVTNLGGVLQDLGDLEGARAHFERALRIDEAAYGQDHPVIATDINNLGIILRGLGDLEGARECFKRASIIVQTYLGNNHTFFKIIKENLRSLNGGLK